MLNRKDEKIFIDLDDEITFIYERIKASQADRIILVAPDSAGILSSLVSLKLLSKLVFKSGKSVVLVTQDDSGLEFAKKVGVVAVKRILDVNENLWAESEDRLKKRGLHPVLGREKEQVEVLENVKTESFAENVASESAPDEAAVSSESPAMNTEVVRLEGDIETKKSESHETEEILPGVEMDNVKTKDAEEEKPAVTESVTDVNEESKSRVQNSASEDFSDTNDILSQFGFVADKDIAKLKTEEDKVAKLVKEETPIVEPMTPSSINQQSTEILDPNKLSDEELARLYPSLEYSSDRSTEVPREPKYVSSMESKPVEFNAEYEPSVQKTVLTNKDMTSVSIDAKKSAKKEFKLPAIKFSFKALIPLIIFLVLGTGVFGAYAYFVAPQAEVNLKVKFDTVNIENEVIATASAGSVDLANLKVPLLSKESEESGSDSATATGTETRGTKAKGKVTLVNKTEEIIQLESGISIRGGGKVFILLASKEIPKADIFAGTLGRAEVDVEAYDIGTEYNLAAGTEFSVEGYTVSAIVGKSFDAFTGGTKNEVKVISAQDRDSLKNSLKERLTTRAIEKVREQLGTTFILNDSMLTTEVTEETFDGNVGDEKESVNLNMTVKAKGMVYSMDDLKALGIQLLNGQVTSGLKLLQDKSEVTAEFVAKDGDNVKVKLKATGIISGDVTETKVKDVIAGKKLEEAKSALSELEGVNESDITLSPSWIPTFMQHVPTIKGNILVKIEVATQNP